MRKSNDDQHLLLSSQAKQCLQFTEQGKQEDREGPWPPWKRGEQEGGDTDLSPPESCCSAEGIPQWVSCRERH